MLCAVIYVDTNGVPRLVGKGEDLAEEQATTLMAAMEAKHSKPHKLHYEIVRYTRATKREVFAERGLSP